VTDPSLRSGLHSFNVPLTPDRRFDLHWALPRLDCQTPVCVGESLNIEDFKTASTPAGICSRASAPGLPADHSAVMLIKHALTAVLLWLLLLVSSQAFLLFYYDLHCDGFGMCLYMSRYLSVIMIDRSGLLSIALKKRL